MEPARGFIALISVIVISTILMGVAATLSREVFFTRFDGLNQEYRRIARSLADGCVEMGLLKVADDYDYLVTKDPAYDAARGGVPVAYGPLYGEDATCLLLGPTTTPPEIAHVRTVPITVRASFRDSYVNLRASASVTDPNYATGSSLPIVTYDTLREVP